MLPFLKKKANPGVITAHMDALGHKSEASQYDEEPNKNAPLEACAQDLMRAIHENNVEAAAAAMRAAFEILESEPHEEGPHPNSYDELNQLAAQKD